MRANSFGKEISFRIHETMLHRATKTLSILDNLHVLCTLTIKLFITRLFLFYNPFQRAATSFLVLDKLIYHRNSGG